MKDWQRQAHVKWDCKYYVVILSKYRRKVLYGRMRRGIGAILRDLCRQAEVCQPSASISGGPSHETRKH